MVRVKRLELSHLAILEPKSSASTNSATLAFATTMRISVISDSSNRILRKSPGVSVYLSRYLTFTDLQANSWKKVIAVNNGLLETIPFLEGARL